MTRPCFTALASFAVAAEAASALPAPASSPASAPIQARPAHVDIAAPTCRPEYPADAVRGQVQGVSVLRVKIDDAGKVLGAAVLRPSGESAQHQELDQAALAAVTRCPAAPALDAQGRPKPSETEVSYAWRLAPLGAPAAASTPLALPPGAMSARVQVGQGCRPDYPGPAARSGAQGTSHLRYTIDAQGQMVGAEIVEPSGPTPAHGLLDIAARDALAKCEYVPGHDAQGHPITTQVEIRYTWKLE